jgi:uncharacterized protein (TIGR00106 family)
MAILQFSVVPLGTGSTSLSEYVAGVHRVIQDSGVKHRLTPMGTVLEGPLDELLAVVRRCHEQPFARGAQRVSTTVSIDDRRDREASAEGKIQSVLDKLG